MDVSGLALTMFTWLRIGRVWSMDCHSRSKAESLSMDEPVHPRSLRAHLDVLRGLDELHEIDREVDWNVEIGAITRRVGETGGPAASHGAQGRTRRRAGRR